MSHPRRAAAAVLVVASAAAMAGCATSDHGFADAAAARAASARVTRADAPTSEIAAWFRAVNPTVSTAEQSVTAAQWAVRRPDHKGLVAACRAIKIDVRAVRAAPELPDPSARTALAREMEAFDVAADQCVAGDLEAAGRSVDRGHRWAEIGGRRVVTLLHRS